MIGSTFDHAPGGQEFHVVAQRKDRPIDGRVGRLLAEVVDCDPRHRRMCQQSNPHRRWLVCRRTNIKRKNV
jgi:hypothetical protein